MPITANIRQAPTVPMNWMSNSTGSQNMFTENDASKIKSMGTRIAKPKSQSKNPIIIPDSASIASGKRTLCIIPSFEVTDVTERVREEVNHLQDIRAMKSSIGN